MNRKLWSSIGVALGLTVLLAPAAFGQAKLVRSVIGSGAAASTDGTIAMAGTIGQTLIGRANAAGTSGAFGFWYTIPPKGVSSISESHTRDAVAAATAVQVTPNPVYDVATIRLMLPVAGQVSLKVYDALGRFRQTVIDGERQSGSIAVQLPAGELESGNYTLVLVAAGRQVSTTMRVVR